MQKFSLSKGFGEVLLRLGAKYSNLVVLDTDLSTASKTHLFAKNFEDRHFYFGVAEQNLVASSVGFAIRGKLPFVCSDALFLTGRAFEQIRNMLAYPNLNVKLVGLDAGLALGKEGATMHALEDLALMCAIPNMQIFSPADIEELKVVLDYMCDNFGPMYLRLAASMLPIVYKGNLKPGNPTKIDVLKEGRDVCIFTSGALVSHVLEAAKILEDEVSIKVLNVSCLKPIDEKSVLNVVTKVKHVVCVEDHFGGGGLGTALAQLFAEKYPTRLHCIGVEGFSESGSKEDLYKKSALNVEGITKFLRKICV